MQTYHSGFVTVIGRPNMGKSTLLNHIIGEKIAIISDKPQTTRNKIQMVYTKENAQIVFLDTPGIQIPKNSLGTYMLKLSKSTLNEVDVITLMVDTSEPYGKLDSMILEELSSVQTPVILLVNKIDETSETELDRLLEIYRKNPKFHQIIPISAREGTHVEAYINALIDLLPEGPQYFPEDMITDQPERLIIGEIIREKALLHLEDEIPHGIAVEIEKIEKRSNRDLIDVFATIYVEKKSHKGMVIGKNGQMISIIGREARMDIENLMDTQVNLQCWVKIAQDWRSNQDKVKNFGYR